MSNNINIKVIKNQILYIKFILKTYSEKYLYEVTVKLLPKLSSFISSLIFYCLVFLYPSSLSNES